MTHFRGENYFGRFYSSTGLVVGSSEFPESAWMSRRMQSNRATKRNRSVPMRPKGNGWKARLWDDLYGSQAVSEAPRKTVLRVNVLAALKKGESLARLRNKLKMLLPSNVDVAETEATKSAHSAQNQNGQEGPVRPGHVNRTHSRTRVDSMLEEKCGENFEFKAKQIHLQVQPVQQTPRKKTILVNNKERRVVYKIRSSRSLRGAKSAKLKVAPVCAETASIADKLNSTNLDSRLSTSQRAKVMGYKAMVKRISTRISVPRSTR